LYGTAKSCCCPGVFTRFPVSGSGQFFPPQLGIRGRRLTLQDRAPCDCVPQSLSRGASTAAAAVLEGKEGTQLVQNSPARLPDVGLGPRVRLPGRRQPARYGTSWSVLVSGTSGRPCSSEPNLFSPFPFTNLSPRSQTACPVATSRCSTALTWATNCAETEPEQSSLATRPVCGHDRTWKEEQTDFIYDCKQFVLRFFLHFCTCLILGLGPQTKPPSITFHHGLVTSH
jgi:hypothetical protein